MYCLILYIKVYFNLYLLASTFSEYWCIQAELEHVSESSNEQDLDEYFSEIRNNIDEFRKVDFNSLKLCELLIRNLELNKELVKIQIEINDILKILVFTYNKGNEKYFRKQNNQLTKQTNFECSILDKHFEQKNDQIENKVFEIIEFKKPLHPTCPINYEKSNSLDQIIKLFHMYESSVYQYAMKAFYRDNQQLNYLNFECSENPKIQPLFYFYPSLELHQLNNSIKAINLQKLKFQNSNNQIWGQCSFNLSELFLIERYKPKKLKQRNITLKEYYNKTLGIENYLNHSLVASNKLENKNKMDGTNGFSLINTAATKHDKYCEKADNQTFLQFNISHENKVRLEDNENYHTSFLPQLNRTEINSDSKSQLDKNEKITQLICRTKFYNDCFDYYKKGFSKNGVFAIKPKVLDTCETKNVYCDMKLGGFTVIMKRINGEVNFYKNWIEYKLGFGDPFKEYWLGNDYIHALTSTGNYSLRIDFEDWDGIKKYAFYDHFEIGSENEAYKLYINGYTGNAGDSFSVHNHYGFSTYDKDNDDIPETIWNGSCAKKFHGAWWYNSCYRSNLNGKYYTNGTVEDKMNDGVSWNTWHGHKYSLKIVEMKIRKK